MWSYDTGCKYHTQETGYYCGAACAMMVLAETGISYAQLDQDELYDSNHMHSASGWYTSPKGLEWTLDKRKPSNVPGFVVYDPVTASEGTRKLVHTLYHYQVSPCVLVYGAQHWVVVRAIGTDKPPTESGYQIQWLRINNPVWNSQASSHDATDSCGTGGALGIEAQFVTYNAWNNTYFTGFKYDPATEAVGSGSIRFVSVCDPEEPRVEPPSHVTPRINIPGRELAPKEWVQNLVQPELERLRITSSREVAETLSNMKQMGDPQLVLRSDQVDSYYYLVPIEAEDGTVALAQMDGRFGDIESFTVLKTPVRELTITDTQIAERIENRRFMVESISREPSFSGFEAAESMRGDLPEVREFPLGRSTYMQPRRTEILQPKWIRVLPATYNLSPILMWEPCAESFSPHLPFRVVNFGPYKLYVRIDGQVFTSLTTHGYGM